jgi:hypothetical protein
VNKTWIAVSTVELGDRYGKGDDCEEHMNTPGITIPMSEVAGQITATITVKGMRRFNLRCQLGVLLLRCAAAVFPFRTEIEVKQ